MELHVEMNQEMYQSLLGDGNHPTVHLLRKKIQHELKNSCLISINVVILKPKTIPRSEGKAIRLLDHRKLQKK